MNTWLARIDDRLCLWFCRLWGIMALIEQMDMDDVSHVLTPERLARAGWTDYQ